MSAPAPSPEVKAMIGEFVRLQREKYGDDWKEKLAAEMAAKTAPVVEKLLSLRNPKVHAETCGEGDRVSRHRRLDEIDGDWS